MKIAYFTHSLSSCWNHGNAHFLRGVLDELTVRGHEVSAFEPQGAWSLSNLLRDHGDDGLSAWRESYPRLSSTIYPAAADPAELAAGSDLVIVHEWNDPALIARLGEARRRGAGYHLLFHDTHHRAVSAPAEMKNFDLTGFDGVLAFGEALVEVYRDRGWGERVWTWHEAADIRRFHPPQDEVERKGLVWIGNWGDDERSDELVRFLLEPARSTGLDLDIFGVRYPEEARRTVASYGARYHGWAPNAAAPGIFARHMATVHVPRRYYADALPGIPTIRVFEALACGIPLVSAPWDDAEHLFRPGDDFLIARSGTEMASHLRALQEDPDLRAALVRSGLETIRRRHTCAHRADELLAIAEQLASPGEARMTA